MKKVLFFSLVAVTLFSCSRALRLPADSGVCVGLNTLLTINEGDNLVHTSDFVMDVARIDSVTCSDAAVTCILSDDKSTVNLLADKPMYTFANVCLWVDGVPYSVPARKSDKIDYRFTWNPQGTHPQRVQIAGQMNNWVPAMTPDMQLNADGLYEVTLHLSPGTYLYQINVDGDQNHDANNPAKVDNGFGKFNSIMQVDGNEAKFPVLTTDTFSAHAVRIAYKNRVERVYAYWQNYLLPDNFVELSESGISVQIPCEAARLERSYLRVWAANEFGVSNDILVPLDYGAVLTDMDLLTRHDKQALIIYFMLVDRFKNGDTANDHPMNRPDVNPKADYQGGDLAGVKQKIDDGYFNRLGVNTLWVSPLNQNPLEPYGYNAVGKTKFAGYHGYWPVSSSQVDFRFGTNDELKTLVADAHDHDINILLDYVANHVHQDHPLYKEHPEFATALDLPDGRKNIALWDEQRLTTWFDDFMPSLDYGNPAVVDMMVDSAVYWMDEFGIDGFRHDACKHVNEEYWRELTHHLKQHNPQGTFYQIGESYGSPELMASYVNSGMLDGQFDFNVFDEATSAFNGYSGGTLTRLDNILRSSLKVYGAHNLMGYISGNHDKPRFMAMASGDLKVGEDAKASAWTRELGITDSVAYDKLALFHAFNSTIPGVPVIYYGDEIGMTGANDPDCRRMMRFDDWNNREEKLFATVSRLNKLRLSVPALVFGDFRTIAVTDTTWIYARKYFGQTAIVLLNNSPREQSFALATDEFGDKEMDAAFAHGYEIAGGKLRITLPPYGFEVLWCAE